MHIIKPNNTRQKNLPTFGGTMFSLSHFIRDQMVSYTKSAPDYSTEPHVQGDSFMPLSSDIMNDTFRHRDS